MSSPCPPPPAAGCPYIPLYLLATLHTRRHLPACARYYQPFAQPAASISIDPTTHDVGAGRSGAAGGGAVLGGPRRLHSSAKRCASRWFWRLRPRPSVGGATRTSRAAEHRRTPTLRRTRTGRCFSLPRLRLTRLAPAGAELCFSSGGSVPSAVSLDPTRARARRRRTTTPRTRRMGRSRARSTCTSCRTRTTTPAGR